jgi:hypothetical protein
MEQEFVKKEPGGEEALFFKFHISTQLSFSNGYSFFSLLS